MTGYGINIAKKLKIILQRPVYWLIFAWKKGYCHRKNFCV